MPSLSAHPIFRIGSESFNPFKATDRRNIIAFKGTEVYVAVGSTVRYAELREWYAMEGDAEDGKNYYRVPAPSFISLMCRR
jgi:hypothetical protein